MADKERDEELIDKLIKKRREENDAFLKLLSAISKGGTVPDPPRPKEKDKPNAPEP